MPESTQVDMAAYLQAVHEAMEANASRSKGGDGGGAGRFPEFNPGNHWCTPKDFTKTVRGGRNTGADGTVYDNGPAYVSYGITLVAEDPEAAGHEQITKFFALKNPGSKSFAIRVRDIQTLATVLKYGDTSGGELLTDPDEIDAVIQEACDAENYLLEVKVTQDGRFTNYRFLSAGIRED